MTATALATALAALNGVTLKKVVLTVPHVGVWQAECSMVDQTPISGAVSLRIGQQRYSGTVVDKLNDAYGGERKVIMVGGGAGWQHARPSARSHHNDAGVRALTVAQDVAVAVGERLGAFVPRAAILPGTDYVRSGNSLAAQTLIDAASGADWWLDFAGVTNVGSRSPPPALVTSTYEVVGYDPQRKTVELDLGVDALSTLGVGSVVTKNLVQPLTVWSYVLEIADTIKATCFCGGSVTEFAAVLESLIDRVIDRRMLGAYLYRIISVGLDSRLNLQPVSAADKLPELQSVTVWPGVYSSVLHIDDTTEVLVQFVSGDRSRPIVTQISQPVSAAPPAARLGDAVEVAPPAGLTITLTGTGPASLGAPYSFVLGPTGGTHLVGTITSGSAKVGLP